MIEVRWDLTSEEEQEAKLKLQKAVRDLAALRKLDRVYGDLSISHFELDAESITSIVGLRPDHVTSKDETLTPKSRYDVRSDRTFWTFSSQRRIAGTDANEHLKWLVTQIEGRLPAFRQIRESGGEIEIRLRAESWSHYQYVELEPETLIFLGRYGILLNFGVRNRRKADGL